jgi:hypothetical protein
MILRRFHPHLVLLLGLGFFLGGRPVLAVPDAPAKRSLPALTEADKEVWRTTLKLTVMRPPCCGACGLFTMKDARDLWGFLTGESPTARGEQLWRRHAKRLLKQFSQESPKRYAQLYQNLEIPQEKQP